MTLQQLKYIITVTSKGNISETAKELYIAQPSLTAAIKDLEEELGITIFNRTNKGVMLRSTLEKHPENTSFVFPLSTTLLLLKHLLI